MFMGGFIKCSVSEQLYHSVDQGQQVEVTALLIPKGKDLKVEARTFSALKRAATAAA
jgi:hypothetical protein